MAERFQLEGYDTHIVKYPGAHGTRLSISETAKLISGEISRICFGPTLANQPVIFLGHSMGGLIAKELSAHCTHYISLATPHQGTTFAKLAPPKVVKSLTPSGYDMIPGSDYLRGLEAVSEALRAKPCLSVSGQFEELVRPAKTTKFGDKHIIIPKANHLTLPLVYRTFAEIYAWLTYEVFNELG